MYYHDPMCPNCGYTGNFFAGADGTLLCPNCGTEFKP